MTKPDRLQRAIVIALHPAWGIAFALIIPAFIAWNNPFDIIFRLATFGIPALRAILIVIFAIAGIYLGRRVGMASSPGFQSSLVIGMIAGIAIVGPFNSTVDFIFRNHLQSGLTKYVHHFSLGMRLLLSISRSLNETIIYRVFLIPAIAAVIGLAWKTKEGRPTNGAIWTAIILAQSINIWFNNTSMVAITPILLIHNTIRYILPGMVWGWLRWRRGIGAALIGSMTAQIIYQPLIGLIIH